MSTNLDEQMAQLGSALSEARQEVAAGRLVDLSAFAEQLRGVCGRIEAAEASEGRRHIEALLALRDELSHLAVGIQGIVNEMTAPAAPGSAASPAAGP